MANEIFLTNNEKFHVFSKSPITPSMGLAQAVNKSGHTTTTADVWSQDIPWFFSADDKATALVTGKNAKLNDLVLIGSAVYKRNATEATEGAAFDTLWESLTLANGTQLYNSDNKHVLTYHKGVPVDFLTTSNNAKQASNYAGRIFINGKVVEQFVASTDKITDGVPSTGYGVAVYKSGSPLSEGEAEANFIANSYAGIIQFNTKVGPSTAYTADVFEYVGDKLDTTLGNIREEIQDIVGVTMEGVVASVGTDEAATSAGIGVDSTSKTSPKITFTAGSVASGETKLVTGDAVKTYVDTTALAEGGSIANAIADYVATNAKVSVNGQSATTITVKGTEASAADLVKVVVTEDKTTENKIGLTLTATLDAAVLNEDGSIDKDGVVIATIAQDIAESVADTAITNAITSDNGAIKDAIDGAISDATLAEGQKIATTTDTSKLVTVEDVTTYVSENAKVTLTQGTGITVTPNGEASTSFTVAVDDSVATKKSVDDLSSLVSALPATIEAAQDTADEAKATADTAVQTVKVNGTEVTKNATEVDITAIVGVDETLANGIKVTKTTDNKVKVSVEPATYTSSNKEWRGSDYFATASDIATAISDAVGAITIPSVTTSSAAQTVGVTASGHEVSVATATYTASTDTWTNKPYLVTGATVEAYVTDVVSEVSSDLTALENKVNAYHKAGVSYKIHTEPTLPDLSIEDNVKEYKNVILLVSKEITGPINPPSALSGDYTEYLCVNKGTEEAPEWVWEQIGTTAADLKGYVKAIRVNDKEKYTDPGDVYLTLGSFAETVASGQATTLANQGSVYANIATDGTLTLGVASATDSVMGVSKMFTGDLTTAASTVTDTAVSVKSAQAMYSTLATLANSKVSEVTGSSYLQLAGIQVTKTGSEVTISQKTITSDNARSIDIYTQVVENGYLDGYDAIDTNAIAFRTEDEAFIQEFIPEGSYLEIWSGDMPNLKYGYCMFANCSNLESFCGDLSSLTSGSYMFNSCNALTSFCGDLSSLTDGSAMFDGCKLDAESLECIADTLPTATGGTIKIGYNCAAADAQAAYDTITGKGWTCTMTYNA